MSTNTCVQSKVPSPLFILRPTIDSSVTALCFVELKGEHYLITGFECGQIAKWSLKTFRCQNSISNENSKVLNLISLNSKELFLSHHKSGPILVYDFEFQIIKSFKASSFTFCKCHLLNDSSIYLSFPSEKNLSLIEIVNFETGKQLCNVGVNDKKYGACLTTALIKHETSHNYFLLIGYESGILTLFKINFESHFSELINELMCFENEMIVCCDYNPYKNLGVCGSVGDQIVNWCLNDKFELSLNRKMKITNPGILSCAIRPDGKIIATGGSDNRIRLLALKSLKPLVVLDKHKQPVEFVLFSNQINCHHFDGFMLAAASRDKTITIWSLYNQ